MDKLYWVWLAEALGYCSAAANSVVYETEDASIFYGKTEEELKKFGFFTKKDIKSILSTPFGVAEKIYQSCLTVGCEIITPWDDTYPDRLKNIPMMPLALYVKGKLGKIDNEPTISMVGSRNASEYGAKVALKLGYDLAKCGFTVVSGLALGIDAFSLKGAVRADGKTIAVLGAGLDINYPAANRELRNIIEASGAVISEYPPGTQPCGHNFPLRNRIMSGLSLGVLVVEAGSKSGSLITAGHALTQGKDVFAIPNDIFDPLGAGTLRLIKEGAKVVTCVQDIMEEYYWSYRDKINTNNIKEVINSTSKEHKQKKLPPKDYPKTSKEHSMEEKRQKAPEYLTDDQLKIFGVLDKEAKSVETLAQKLGMSMYALLSALTELEIYGLVEPLPGKMFRLKV